MSLQAGQIVAEKYRIVRMLGQGGMGEVYEGENLRIHRRVAIKTLLSSVSSRGDVVQRFEREAQAAGRIGSEHIVEVLDMGDLPDQSRYMVMEFLEGSTLSDRIISRGRVPSREAARIVIEICEGLQAAHDAQIIHRDLKPANVFLLSTKQGRPDFVKILDFGVSKFSVLSDEMSMTSTGAVVGTPYYMSPEQAKGAKFIDARSDLYSVGVILYETITGQVPFNAQTFNELIFKIALESPPPPESFVPDLDPHFAGIVRKAMAREPNERFQSANEFRETLEAWATAFDRASMAGGQVGGGGYLQGPGGRAGGTQIIETGQLAPPQAPVYAAPRGTPQGGVARVAGPAGMLLVGNSNPFANAPANQTQARPVAVHPPGNSGSKGSAGIAFVIALLVVLVAGGAVAGVMVLRNKSAGKVAASSATLAEASPASAAPTITAPPVITASTPSASSAQAATGEASAAAPSVTSLPNASSNQVAATPAPALTGHLPSHPPVAATSKPTAATQPTSKPGGGRPITGDL